MHEEARAFKTVLLNKSWTRARLVEEGVATNRSNITANTNNHNNSNSNSSSSSSNSPPQPPHEVLEGSFATDSSDPSCGRCGAEYEDEWHRYWHCIDNNFIDHWSIKGSDGLKAEAMQDKEHACYWLKGIVPASKLKYKANDTWTDYDDCHYTTFGDFEGILSRNKKAGTDGAAVPELHKAAIRVTAAAAVYDAERGEAAAISSKVPGPQTVPRAELWALVNLCNAMEEGSSQKVYIDASSVVEGYKKKNEKKQVEGINGDLWTLLKQLVVEKSLSLEVVKVKSHVEDGAMWRKYGMDADKFIHNELADEYAGKLAQRLARSEAHQASDSKTEDDAFKIALRIACIGARCWSKTPQKILPHKNNDTMKRAKAEKITEHHSRAKRAADEEHETYIAGKYSKCRHCTGKTRPDNTKYWQKRKCDKLVIRTLKRKEGDIHRIIREGKNFDLTEPVESYDIGEQEEEEEDEEKKKEEEAEQ